MRRRLVIAAALASAALGACRIEHLDAKAAAPAAATPATSFESKNFDPKAEVAKFWDAKVLPEATQRAGEYVALRRAMQQNLDAAGDAHGHRERGAGAPWNLFTTIKGRVVEADTEASAGSIGIDVDGDGKPDVQVQIGPVVRGTSIRDALSFISFTSYTNQVDFAQLANAFNRRAMESAMHGVARDSLKGKDVTVLGVFTTDDAAQAAIVTPLKIEVGGAS